MLPTNTQSVKLTMANSRYMQCIIIIPALSEDIHVNIHKITIYI